MSFVQGPPVNPFSPIASAMTNLAKVLFSGPTAEDRAAKEAQRLLYTAQTEHSRAQTAKLQQELSAASTITNAVGGMYAPPDPIAYPETQTFDAPPDMVPIRQSRDAQVAQYMPDLWKGVAQTGKIGDIGAIINAAVANAPGSSDNAVIRSLAGRGTAIGKDQAVSLPGQENIREGNFAADYRKAMDEALLKERGLNDRAAMTDARSLVQVVGDDNIPRWAQKSQAVGGRAPSTGAQPTPRNYMTPDGQQGLTFDGRTDAQSGAVLPQGVQIINKGVQAQDMGGLTKGDRSKAVLSQNAQQRFLKYLDQGRALAQDERNFGASGMLRGAVQDAVQQGSALARTLGVNMESIQREILQSGADVDLGMFDPRLPQMDAFNNILAYEAAKVMAEQSGRSVSNQDIKTWRGIIGATGPLANRAEYLARLDQLEKLTGINQQSTDRLLSPGAAGNDPLGIR